MEDYTLVLFGEQFKGSLLQRGPACGLFWGWHSRNQTFLKTLEKWREPLNLWSVPAFFIRSWSKLLTLHSFSPGIY